MLATFSTFALSEFTAYERALGDRIWKIILLGIRQVGYAFLVFLVIHVANKVAYGSFPNWGLAIADISTFNTGYGKLPLPAFGLFELHVLVYGAFALWIFLRVIRSMPVHPLAIFFTVYGIFSLQYYIGNSAWSYLNFVSIPMLVLVCYGLKQYSLDHTGLGVPRRLVAGSFVGLVTFMGVLTAAKVPTTFAYRDYTNIDLAYAANDHERDLAYDAAYIKTHFSEQRIAMFHYDDGMLLTSAGKINMFYLQNNDERLYSLYDDYLIVFRRQLQGLKNQVDEMKPEHIFVSNTPDGRVKEFESFLQHSYAVETRLRTLTVYKRKE